jgi:hypothetical protein
LRTLQLSGTVIIEDAILAHIGLFAGCGLCGTRPSWNWLAWAVCFIPAPVTVHFSVPLLRMTDLPSLAIVTAIPNGLTMATALFLAAVPGRAYDSDR